MSKNIFSKYDIFQEIDSPKSKTGAPVQDTGKLGGVKVFLNLISLTAIIFVVGLFAVNFNAYRSLIFDTLDPDQLIEKKEQITEAIESTEIDLNEPQIILTEEEREQQETESQRLSGFLQKHLSRQKVAVRYDQFSAKNFLNSDDHVALNVEITPYEDRIVIPKIGKNIPLVTVDHHKATNSNEWHRIFMEELANGVIRYPWSALPGTEGNSFVFGHSSNFPWVKGNYNEVFALLDNLEDGDEIIAYYKQKKYVYKTYRKEVIRPGYVNTIEDSEDKKLLTLMTCWPVGTTLNRLLVIAELQEDGLTPEEIKEASNILPI